MSTVHLANHFARYNTCVQESETYLQSSMEVHYGYEQRSCSVSRGLTCNSFTNTQWISTCERRNENAYPACYKPIDRIRPKGGNLIHAIHHDLRRWKCYVRPSTHNRYLTDRWA